MCVLGAPLRLSRRLGAGAEVGAVEVAVDEEESSAAAADLEAPPLEGIFGRPLLVEEEEVADGTEDLAVELESVLLPGEAGPGADEGDAAEDPAAA